jgi:hypothetical protein
MLGLAVTYNKVANPQGTVRDMWGGILMYQREFFSLRKMFTVTIK